MDKFLGRDRLQSYLDENIEIGLQKVYPCGHFQDKMLHDHQLTPALYFYG